MRLTTLFLLATLAMSVNLADALEIDYDGKIKNSLTGEPMVDPGDFVNNLRGSVTVNFFTDTRIDGQNAGEKPAGIIPPVGNSTQSGSLEATQPFNLKTAF